MADSTVTYAGDGSTNLWTVTFPYLDKSHVHLYVDESEDLTFTWVTDSSIAATSTPGVDAVVTITRITPRSSLVFSFGNSGTFRGTDLNNQALQALYVATEGFDALTTTFNLDPADNKWNSSSKAIKNVLDPSNAQDAATKAYVDSVAGSASAAAASASAASASQSAAAASASAAAASASAASTSETNAAASEAAAAASAASIGTMWSSGDNWGVIPSVDVSGVLEIGKYVDFHETDAGVEDYSARLQSVSGVFQTGAGLPLLTGGTHTIWIPGTAFYNGTGHDYVTFGTAPMSCIEHNPTTTEWRYFLIGMPKSWDEGTISYQVYWGQAAAGTGDVIWRLEAGCWGDSHALANTFDAVQVTDTGGTANDIFISPTSSAISMTSTGPAENELLRLTFGRAAADGGDTLGVSAYTFGVKVFITIAAPNDA